LGLAGAKHLVPTRQGIYVERRVIKTGMARVLFSPVIDGLSGLSRGLRDSREIHIIQMQGFVCLMGADQKEEQNNDQRFQSSS
jgi:hypothetical protein